MPEPFATVVIPARLESSRLPRKMLADVCGRTLLRRTFDVAVAAACGPVLVLTDAEEVAEEVRSFGGEAVLTSAELESGTARIAAVAGRLSAGIVVNLQGDAPLTEPEVVGRSVREAARSGAAVALPVYRITRAAELNDPTVVKVVRARDGRVLYCSRSPVPHVRDARPEAWPEAASFWAHIGLYAYSLEFLRSFAELPESPLEQAERLEQLRWLEAGVRLHSFEVPPQGPAVDTPAQLQEVRAIFSRRSADE